jgi:hypothetical protein
MSFHWPTPDDIQVNNAKVILLVQRYHSAEQTDLETIFNEALQINPNHTSIEYADKLNILKFNLYQQLNNNNNDNDNTI